MQLRFYIGVLRLYSFLMFVCLFDIATRGSLIFFTMLGLCVHGVEFIAVSRPGPGGGETARGEVAEGRRNQGGPGMHALHYWAWHKVVVQSAVRRQRGSVSGDDV